MSMLDCQVRYDWLKAGQVATLLSSVRRPGRGAAAGSDDTATSRRSKCSERKSPPGLRLLRRTGCRVCRC